MVVKLVPMLKNQTTKRLKYKKVSNKVDSFVSLDEEGRGRMKEKEGKKIEISDVREKKEVEGKEKRKKWIRLISCTMSQMMNEE